MKRNMGSVDRVIRFFIAMSIGFLYYTNTVKGNFAIAGVGIAVFFLITSLSGFCPVYALIGISTNSPYNSNERN